MRLMAKNRREASRIAAGAGMHPSGLSGYFRSGLVQRKGDVRWITERGKDRLRELPKRRNLPSGKTSILEE
jgi:hypothetical protein